MKAGIFTVEALKQKQTDLERARVEAQFAERDLKRQLALIAKGSVSESQRDDAELRHDKSRKDVLKLQHEVTEILASLANKPDIAVAEHPLFIAAQTAVAKASPPTCKRGSKITASTMLTAKASAANRTGVRVSFSAYNAPVRTFPAA